MGFDLFCSRRVNGGRVHAARIEIADLLLVGTRCGFSALSGFQNLAQVLLVLVRKLCERTPARILRRNRVGFHPTSHCELIEIVTRLASLVQICGIEAPRIWLVRRSCGRAEPGTRKANRQNSNKRNDASSKGKSF